MNSFQAKRITILLVDPEVEAYCKSIGATFRNCHVIVEKNKQKACEFFFRNAVDLVLLDHTPDEHIHVQEFYQAITVMTEVLTAL